MKNNEKDSKLTLNALWIYLASYVLLNLVFLQAIYEYVAAMNNKMVFFTQELFSSLEPVLAHGVLLAEKKTIVLAG